MKIKNYLICTNCKSQIQPKQKKRGSFMSEVILWLLPVGLYVTLYAYCVSEYGCSFEEYLNLYNEILLIGSQQPLYLQTDEIQRLYYFITVVEGSFVIWIVALIYSLWRFLSTSQKVCKVCEGVNCFVPVKTPEGQRIIKETVQVEREK